jgi:hypothetical protein
MPNYVQVEPVISTGRPRAIGKPRTGNRLIVSTGILVFLGFLMLLTWRELASEVNASVRDFVSSLDIHDRPDSRWS